MSIRDVMILQDTIGQATLPAGAGDFSRTAFEYSKEIAVQPTVVKSDFTPLVLGKFIAPKTGLYKYECDYTLKATNGLLLHSKIQITNYIFPYASSQPLPKGTEVKKQTDDYMARFIKEELKNEYFSTIVEEYPSWNEFTLESATTISRKEWYFSAMEGQVFVLYVFYSANSSLINDRYFTVRNQKITY